jgi:hypothetical protein
LNAMNQNQQFLLPNPLVIDNGTVVLLEATNDGINAATLWATLFGEDI